MLSVRGSGAFGVGLAVRLVWRPWLSQMPPWFGSLTPRATCKKPVELESLAAYHYYRAQKISGLEARALPCITGSRRDVVEFAEAKPRRAKSDNQGLGLRKWRWLGVPMFTMVYCSRHEVIRVSSSPTTAKKKTACVLFILVFFISILASK